MTDYKAILKRVMRKVATFVLYESGALAHKTKVGWDNVRHIRCRADEMTVLHSCSNNLYHIHALETEGYFRPVLPHTDLKSCVRTAIENYFTSMYPEQITEWEQVKNTLTDKASFRKLLHVGNYSDPCSAAREFYLTKDTTVVGIETPSSLRFGSDEWKTFILNIDHFLKYVMNTIGHHCRNKRGGKWEFSNANRQMATEAIARLCGLDYMIPHSEFVVIKTHNGIDFRGTLMEKAEGESTEEITAERSHSVCSPALQRELIKLNILDTITFERDHRPGNYNMILDKSGKVKGLSVFDNDAEMTFAPMPAIAHSGSGSSRLIGKEGVNRPYMDADIAERVLQLNKKEVKKKLNPYLNWLQIEMCWHRIESLQKAIRYSSRQEGFLLKSGQWTEATISEELSGRYGRTYLDTFVNNEQYNKAYVEYNNVAPL